MTKQKLYPERKRCVTCRSALRDIVIKQLYCSYACSDMPAPLEDIDKAPRECKTERENQWHWKKKWLYDGQVPQRIREDPSTNLYTCNYCGYIHIGHSRPKTEEKGTVLDPERLPSIFKRLRGDRDIKYVASKIGCRPIRIKEIENGHASPDITVLFKLAKYYNCEIQLLLPNGS